MKNDLINEFLALHPEYKDKTLKVGNHNNITTSKGKTLAVKDSDGWRLVSVGGRPTESLKSHSLKVRLTQDQYKKVSDSAYAQGITKVAVIRGLIDEL